MATDATLVGTHDTPGHDTLVPDPQVQEEFGVTAMSIWRWDRDPELIKLGWPPPIRIRSRKFRSRIALENFKRVMARRAIEQRARPSEPERGDHGLAYHPCPRRTAATMSPPAATRMIRGRAGRGCLSRYDASQWPIVVAKVRCHSAGVRSIVHIYL